MADFLKVLKMSHLLGVELQRRLAEKDEFAAAEYKATIDIQRIFRGKLVRDLIRNFNEAEIKISRCYRGHLGRKRARKFRQERIENERLWTHDYHICNIQRSVRGHLSRKNIHCYATHKENLKKLEKTGDLLRESLAQYQNDLRRLEENREKEKRSNKLIDVSSNLHHLVSTKAQPGIFNSPYIRESDAPTIGGVTVEEYLTNCIRDLLRRRGYKKLNLAADLSGTLKMPPPIPRDRKTVQASQPYNLPHQVATFEETQHRYKLLGPRFFAAGQRVHSPTYRRGVSEGTKYVDQWKNPYLSRGPMGLQRYGESSAQNCVLEKPFIASVGGNKSTVLPNGLFDVILEAQYTGGTTARCKGKTRRFGVPDNCDTVDEQTLKLCQEFGFKIPSRRKHDLDHFSYKADSDSSTVV